MSNDASPGPGWPTQVRSDGSSPTSIELVASGDRLLVREGLYQMQAAVALEDRGHEIRAFQGALVGSEARITIPIVIVGQPLDACAYTECEPWSDDRIQNLKDWLRELRKESDSDVIVVARNPSPIVAALPEVKEFIHLPYDNLPKPD